MKTSSILKKLTLVMTVFLMVITLSSCGKKTASYEGISDDVYASAGKYQVTYKELYDLLKYQKNGFTFTSTTQLDEIKEEKIFTPWIEKVNFSKSGDELRDAEEDQLNDYEKDVRDLINKAVYSTTDEEEIAKLSEKSVNSSKVKFLDSFVSQGINADNIFDLEILNTYKLDVAKRQFAREILTVSVEQEFVKDEDGEDTDDENDDYISATDIEEYFEDNYENKNPLDAMLIKFVSKNEADQTLQLFGNIEVDGVYYKGLKSYKSRLYLIPKTYNDDNTELSTEEYKDYYNDYTVSSSDLCLDDVMTNNNEATKGLYTLVEYVKMYQYMYGYKSEITDQDIEDLAKKNSLEEAIEAVKQYDNNKFNYEYDELTDINTSLRSYLYTTLVANPEEGKGLTYRYSSSPRSYGSNYYLIYKLTDQEKVEITDDIRVEIKEKIFDEKLNDTYVTNKVNELLDLVTFTIYDPEIELIYTLNNSDYETTKDKNTEFVANIKVKADTNLLVEEKEYSISPVEFFNKLEETAGPSFAFNTLAEKALLDSKYADTITEDDIQEWKESFKSIMDSFSNDYFSSYGLPASMGRKNFIKLYFNADSINEVIDVFYKSSHIITEYVDDIYAHYGEGDTTRAKLQKYAISNYENFYSASANHFLTYLDIDEDENPDDPADYIATLSTEKAEEFKALVYEFNTFVYEETSKLSGTHYSSFETIINEFKESTRIVPSNATCEKEPSLVDCKWAKYKKAGLNVKTEDLSTITNSDSLNYDEAFIAKFEEMLDSQNYSVTGQYMQPLGTSYDDLLTSTFGWHIIVLTGTTDQVSAQFLESDDDFDGKSYYNNIVYYEEDGTETVLNAYNTNFYPSLNQIDIYLRERTYTNGVENLPAAVSSALETLFKPVMDQYDSDSNKLFLLRNYLLSINTNSQDGITFADNTLEATLHETFKVTVRSAIGYEYLENIAKNPLGTWYKDLYNFEA